MRSVLDLNRRLFVDVRNNHPGDARYERRTLCLTCAGIVGLLERGATSLYVCVDVCVCAFVLVFVLFISVCVGYIHANMYVCMYEFMWIMLGMYVHVLEHLVNF